MRNEYRSSNAVINGIRLADHLGLVYSVVNRYKRARGKLDEEDLMQAGMMGLCKGLERFDHNRGVRVSTYVLSWIRHDVQRLVGNESRTVRIPVHRWTAGAQRPDEWSLDVPIAIDGTAWVDTLKTPEPGPEELTVELDETRRRNRRVRSALRKLPPRERHVVKRRGQHNETLQVVADGLKHQSTQTWRGGRRETLTRERVRQIEAKALHALRETLEKSKAESDP